MSGAFAERDGNEFADEGSHSGEAGADEGGGDFGYVGEVGAIGVGPGEIVVVDVGEGDEAEYRCQTGPGDIRD